MKRFVFTTLPSIFIALEVCMLTNTIQAQQFPAVIVKDDVTGAYTPLKMSALKIEVKVVANLATTTMAMTFYNDLNRVLEGQLMFPLGAGQTVSGFAMDVNGALREGVVVEKEKGRQVFEDVVRRQIDPGLLEWTKGNTFKSRVYPIPAKGYKQIVLTYEQELLNTGSGFGYALPLQFKDKVDTFVVKVEVFKQNIAPNLDKNELENFQFKQWRESYLAQAEFKDYLPNKQLTFTLPKEANRQRIFVETDPSSAPGVLGSYFYLNLDPKLLQAGKKLPQKICLLWDVSGSVASRDIEKELAVLDGYFHTIGNLMVEVVRFSNTVEAPQRFTVKDGQWTELAQHLKSLPYDGGTQLGALDLNAYTCDEFILSSDGISNFGAADITLAKTPMIVLNSCLTVEHSYLQYLARATGGVYLNLATLTSAQALSLLSTQPYAFISATYAKGSITETYPSLPTVVTNDFALAGILLKDQAEITLNFGFGSDVKYSQTIMLDKTQHASASGLAKRIWAQKKIAELDVMYARNAEAITELGKQFAVVTRNTSLIVLDRLEDYVKYRIVPPKEMQEEYFSIIKDEEAAQKKSEREHLDEVAALFQVQKEWWHKEFPFGKPPKPKAQKKNGEQDESREMNRAAPAPQTEAAPMAMQPEMTLGEAARDGLGSGQAMTGSAADTEEKKSGGTSVGTADITLAKWDPQTPYLQALRQKPNSAWYATYLDQKKQYANSSAFYLDVADFFAEAGQRDVALRILSNIAEMELENHQLLRILGYRLMQTGHYALAIAVFEDVLKIRAEEPQSYRDLGLAFAADKQCQQAVDRLYDVVRKAWDDRFPEIELIALHELNAIVATCGGKLDVGKFDERLVQNLPVDIRVILTWDADNCDIDLWVIDPNGEQCDYSHQATYIGGRMSRDFTRGYGPEEFLLKRALPGKYQIKANYYGNRQQILAGATTIQATLFTNFGKPNQKQKAITLRLKDTKEVVNVGEFEFK
jgi:hypothetical protein